MARLKRIAPITDEDIQDIIDNSVQGQTNRLPGNAVEQKIMFVRPIANRDNTPSVANLIKRVAEEAEGAIDEVEGETPFSTDYSFHYPKTYAQIISDIDRYGTDHDKWRGDEDYAFWEGRFNKAPVEGTTRLQTTAITTDGYVLGMSLLYVGGCTVEGFETQYSFMIDKAEMFVYHNPTEIPLVVDEVLDLTLSPHTDIVVGYTNSIDLDSLNKVPKKGDKFGGICRSKDSYVYGFVAEITQDEIVNGNSAKFKFTEVWLLHDAFVDEAVKATPIVLKELLTLGWGGHTDVESGSYTNSMASSILPRTPKTGETLYGFLKTTDGYIYNFYASVTGGVNSAGKVPFKLSSVVRVYTPAQKDAEITSMIAAKQDKLVFDGTYNADSNKVATVQTVNNTVNNKVAEKVAEIVAGADTKYDTLKEIADWINNHPNNVADINTKITMLAEVKANRDELSKVATSGVFDDLRDKPPIVKTLSAEIIDGKLVLTLTDKDGTKVSSANVDFPEGGGGQGVPPVTTEDNGKVLTVANGEWAAKPLPKYQGEYKVTPDADGEILSTNGQYMEEDLIVNEIPYSDVGNNEGGGRTITIG